MTMDTLKNGVFKGLFCALAATMMLCPMDGRSQSPTAPALGFNIFLENDGTLVSSNTGGPVAMGGNLNIGGSYQLALNSGGTYQVSGVTIGLLVGGQVNYNGGSSFQVNSNSYVKIGNSTNSYVWYVDQNNAYSPIRITPGNNYNGNPRIELQANSQSLGVSATTNPVFQSGLINFTTAFNTMRATSTSMSSCTDNATLTDPNGNLIPHTGLPNQVKITLNSGINTLNLTGADMNNVQNFTYNNSADASHILVINVNAPGTFNWTTWNNGGSSPSTAPYIIYNFYNTTTLNINGYNAIDGTVFAPYANASKTSNYGAVSGQLIAKSFNHNAGSFNYANFTPTVTGCSVATPTVPSFTINNNTQCLTGNSFVFTNTSTGGTPLTYSWSFGDNTTSTSANPTKTYAAAGTYAVKLKVTGSGGVDSVTQNVTVNAMVTPTVSITANPGTTICSGTPVSFTATPVNGGTTPVIQWKKNGTNVGTGGLTYTNSTLNNNDIITCELTSNAGCPTGVATSNSITMTVNPLPATPGAFSASEPTTYQGQTGVVYTVPNVATVTYAWSYSGTGVTINGTGNSVTLDFSNTATSGVLSVTATTLASCGPSAARTKSITVNQFATWNCQNSTNWNGATNWDCGFVPSGGISVLIPANAPCMPKISSGTSSCRNLSIESGATLTIDSGAVLNASGAVQINGSVEHPGYLKLSGTTAQTLSGNGRVTSLALNNSQGATINSGDTIHIGKYYQPGNGTLTVNGGLELLSDSLTTAVILGTNSSCNYISGEVICNKYIHGGRRAFRFLGHPYSQSIPLTQITPYIDITGQGGASNGFTTTATNNPSAFWYNTLTGNGSTVNDSTGWIPYTNTDGSGVNAWKKLQGIRVLIRGQKGEGFGTGSYTPSAVTIKTHGPVNECDVTFNCLTNANAGFNLISNPYACNIDLNQISRGSAVGANFSVWDPNQGLYGAYVSQPFSFSYILPAHSMFVTTCTSASNNAITFHETDKTAGNASGNLFKTTSGFGNDVVQLRILSNNDHLSWDRLLLFYNGQANSAADPLDNPKMGNPDLDFYTLSSDDKELSVDVRPFVNSEVIRLGLRATTQQSYTIRVDDYDLSGGNQLYLHDKWLHNSEPLAAGMHYDFDVTADPLSQGENRFEINGNMFPTYTETVTSGSEIEINMSPNPASERVNISFEGNRTGETTIRITTLIGKEVYKIALGQQNSGSVMVPLQNLAQGVYLVHITVGDQIVVKRLIKK